MLLRGRKLNPKKKLVGRVLLPSKLPKDYKTLSYCIIIHLMKRANFKKSILKKKGGNLSEHCLNSCHSFLQMKGKLFFLNERFQ